MMMMMMIVKTIVERIVNNNKQNSQWIFKDHNWCVLIIVRMFWLDTLLLCFLFNTKRKRGIKSVKNQFKKKHLIAFWHLERLGTGNSQTMTSKKTQKKNLPAKQFVGSNVLGPNNFFVKWSCGNLRLGFWWCYLWYYFALSSLAFASFPMLESAYHRSHRSRIQIQRLQPKYLSP